MLKEAAFRAALILEVDRRSMNNQINQLRIAKEDNRDGETAGGGGSEDIELVIGAITQPLVALPLAVEVRYARDMYIKVVIMDSTYCV